MKRVAKTLIPVIAAIAVAILEPVFVFEDGCACRGPLIIAGSVFGCGGSGSGESPHGSDPAVRDGSSAEKETGIPPGSDPIVTFVEIGSVNCVPCRMMQPVMRSIEKKYAGRVKIVFYDVWTPHGKSDAMKYGVRVIPTQVFLDSKGKEYFRHEGFFPEEDVDRVLRAGGVR